MFYLTKDRHRKLNLIITSVTLFTTGLLLISLFFPILKYGDTSNAGIYIFYKFISYQGSTVKVVTTYGLLILIFVLALFCSALFNFIKLLSWPNKTNYTKITFWTFMTIFYFPVVVDIYGSGPLTIIGNILVTLDDAGETHAKNIVFSYSSSILTAWYYVILCLVIILYLCFLGTFYLYFMEKDLEDTKINTDRPEISHKSSRDLKLLYSPLFSIISSVGIILTLMLGILMFIPLYHWIGSETFGKPRPSLLVDYAWDGSYKIVYYIRSTSVWYLLHIVGIMISFILYLLSNTNKIYLPKIGHIVLIQLLILLIHPNLNFYQRCLHFIPGIGLNLYELESTIEFVINYQLYADYYNWRAKPILNANVWIFVLATILLLALLLMLILCLYFPTKKKSAELEK